MIWLIQFAATRELTFPPLRFIHVKVFYAKIMWREWWEIESVYIWFASTVLSTAFDFWRNKVTKKKKNSYDHRCFDQSLVRSVSHRNSIVLEQTPRDIRAWSNEWTWIWTPCSPRSSCNSSAVCARTVACYPYTLSPSNLSPSPHVHPCKKEKVGYSIS